MFILVVALPIYLAASALAVLVSSPSAWGLVGILSLAAVGAMGWALSPMGHEDRGTKAVAACVGVFAGATSAYLLSLLPEEAGLIALGVLVILLTPLMLLMISISCAVAEKAAEIGRSSEHPAKHGSAIRQADGQPGSEGEDQVSGDAFSSLRSLAERQLQIQYTVASTFDAQAVGVLALNGALAAAAIAADTLLGHDWWLALIGLAISSLFCLMALGRDADGVGPGVEAEIARAETITRAEMDQEIVAFLSGDLRKNKKHLTAKRKLTWTAVAVLILTIVWAVLIMRVS